MPHKSGGKINNMKPFLYQPILEKDDNAKITMTDSNSGGQPSSGNQQIINGGNNSAKTAESIAGEAKTDDQKKVNEVKRQILTKMSSLYSNLYQVKYQTVEEMVSGYMKLIKAHVSSYIKVGTKKEGE